MSEEKQKIENPEETAAASEERAEEVEKEPVEEPAAETPSEGSRDEDSQEGEKAEEKAEEEAESAAETREGQEGESAGESAKSEEEEKERPGESAVTPAAAAPVESDKNRLAQRKVQEARRMVESAEEEIEECIRNIEEDLQRFEEYERESLLPVVDESRRLLKEIEIDDLPETEKMFPSIELPSPEEDKPRIRELSSGKGGAFFLSFLAGILTLGGWYLFAVKKTGEPLLPQGQPDMALLNKLSIAISEFFGQGPNPSVGMAVVVVSTLVVMWLVYTILVAIRASKNIHEAEKIEEEAGFYCKKKEECREMMKRVREHLATMDQTVRKFEVILHEKNAGLRRALHLEDAETFDQLHEKSKQEARELQELLQELDRLLETPMARSGMLTEESVGALRHAKRTINDYILRLYS